MVINHTNLSLQNFQRVIISKTLFNEMLIPLELLLTLKRVCQEAMKSQYRNVKASVIDEFLEEAIKRGIIMRDQGTYTLLKLQVERSAWANNT